MTETTERQEQVNVRLTPEQARWLDRRAARGFGGRAVIVRALIDQAISRVRVDDDDCEREAVLA